MNLEKSDLNQFPFINIKGGIRLLLHPVPHGMNTGGAHTIWAEIITVLTRYRPIVLELI